jgi:uncharacterized protein YegP (UPF0339 family)
MPVFTIDPASGGVRAHFWGDNQKLVWWTEVYQRKAGAQHAIDLMKKHAASAPVVDRAKNAA